MPYLAAELGYSQSAGPYWRASNDPWLTSGESDCLDCFCFEGLTTWGETLASSQVTLFSVEVNSQEVILAGVGIQQILVTLASLVICMR